MSNWRKCTERTTELSVLQTIETWELRIKYSILVALMGPPLPGEVLDRT